MANLHFRLVTTILAVLVVKNIVQGDKFPYVTGPLGDRAPDARTMQDFMAKYYIGCPALKKLMDTTCAPPVNPYYEIQEKYPFNGSIFGKRTTVTNGRDLFSKIFGMDLPATRTGRQLLCCEPCEMP